MVQSVCCNRKGLLHTSTFELHLFSLTETRTATFNFETYRADGPVHPQSLVHIERNEIESVRHHICEAVANPGQHR